MSRQSAEPPPEIHPWADAVTVNSRAGWTLR
jgi:hypothetical protein